VSKEYDEWRLALILNEVGLPDCRCGNRGPFEQIGGFYLCRCADGSEHWFRFDCTQDIWVEDPHPFVTATSES